jgi:hypothetical protein
MKDDHENNARHAHLDPADHRAGRQSHRRDVGLQYAINSSFLVRGEVEHYQVNDSVGHRGGVNMVFPFGRAAA